MKINLSDLITIGALCIINGAYIGYYFGVRVDQDQEKLCELNNHNQKIMFGLILMAIGIGFLTTYILLYLSGSI